MRHWLRWGCCVAAVLSVAVPASAQRRGANHRRQHVPKENAEPAPVASPSIAPQPAGSPTPAGPWSAAQSRLIVSAESLAVVTYYRETTTAEGEDFLGGSARTEIVRSGFSVNVMKGTELILPFSTTRLGLDGVLTRGLTLGTSLGYSSVGGHIETTQAATGVPSEVNESDATDVSLMVFVPRIGYLFAPNQYISVWVRGGFGYARIDADDPDSNDDLEREMFNLVVDPMLISSPIEHFGILLGPQLNFGLGGDITTPASESADIATSLTHSSYGITVGLAFLL